MTDQNQSDRNNSASDSSDLELARAIRNLDREMRPERDLWVGIERSIIDFPQKQKREWDWMPIGVAASLLIAVSAMLLNVLPTAQFSQRELVSVDQSFDRMNAEYRQVRNPLVEQFTEVNKDLDDQTLTDLYRNLEILAEARNEIEAQVREQPENHRLVELLMKIHEQELELLKQDFSRSTRAM